ncbi:E3 ubiquitin-protein ligase TRIM39-like [Sinocyclocheilus grahami]|uniref:E3 ubiquitin-protein ligase TRIM39-like n=1 Tax=Sinocyclocheilus grahami TaxID=75366 RepID=UPI0007AC8C1C|nr:PREDICTED: E3 ubiquitin-protein ligase TRIM39-like [Sinocyclocheilus grahami]
MASSRGPLNEELQCSICLDVFTDPVTTPCGHNFCRTCLNKCWTNTQTCFCPLCKETFSRRPDLKINSTLREVVQHFKEKLNLGESEVLCDICDGRKQKAVKSCLMCQSSYCETHLEPHHRVPRLKKHTLINAVENLEDYICQKHERPLELFCRDDQTSVCLSCTEGDHRTHNTVPIEEESQQKKNQLLQTQTDVQQMIQNRMKKIQEIQHSVEMRKMYSSLCSRPHIKNCTEIRIDSDVNVYSMNRALIQLEKTLDGRLKKIGQTGLKCLQKFAVDVTLDPDTAISYLILSDDGKQVSHGDIERDVPENPKRFNKTISVLAKQGFSSGRFYYEVQVKGKTEWDLGVARESINRKGAITYTPVNGCWTLILRNENEYKACENSLVSLSLSVKPEIVGVFVDYEEGLVSFYDVGSSSHIYSFTGQTFTEKLYPYFSPYLNKGGKNSKPLIITPVNK